uniref:Peptidase A2 domain-containing protein n=1 Tax=Lutzomyia longipalpis TaxID=7200 RepID=A0A1B0CA53_LUTLO
MIFRQRGGIVSTITRIEGLVNGLTEAEILLLGTREVLESQLRLVGQMRNKFLVVQTTIITDQKDEEKKKTEVEYQKEILDRCDALTLNITSMLQQAPSDPAGESKSDLCDFMREIMQQNQKYMMDLVNALSHGQGSGQIPNYHPPTVTKLPQIQLPAFDGKYSDWLSFRDRFQSSVIDHPALSDVQKLDYLKSALTSHAASTIKHLSTTATNFPIAWDLLVQRFERKNEIVADHIRSLYSIPRVSSSDTQAMHQVYNTLSESVMALDAMEITGRDPWIVQFVLDKLDTESKVLWGRECGTDVPSLPMFKKFLMQRCVDAQNSTENPTTENDSPTPRNQRFAKSNVHQRQLAVTQSEAPKPNCQCCAQALHPLYRCPKFLSMSAFERYDVVKRLGLCRNCLDPHMTNSCTFRVCRKCQGKHNILLHEKFVNETNPTNPTNPPNPSVPTTPPNPTTQNVSEPSPPNSASLVGVASAQRTRVYLMTARVDVLDVDGRRVPCRLLLDGGAEVNVITSELAQKLRIPKRQSNVAVVGVGGHQTKIRHQMTATICSQISEHTFTFECQVMTKATGNIPGWITDKMQYNIPQHVTLADPLWADQKPIDIIVGGDVFWFSLLTNVISLGPGMPHLRETVFGYAIVGEQHSVPTNGGVVCHTTTSTLEITSEGLQDNTSVTHETEFAEGNVVDTHSCIPEDRFSVNLPYKGNPVLGESHCQVISHLPQEVPSNACTEVTQHQCEAKFLLIEATVQEDSDAISLKKDDSNCVHLWKSLPKANETQPQMNPGNDAESIQQHFPRNRGNIASGLFWDSIPEKCLLSSLLDGTQEVEIKRSIATIVSKLRISWNVSPPGNVIQARNGCSQELWYPALFKPPWWIPCFTLPVTADLLCCDPNVKAYGRKTHATMLNENYMTLFIANSKVDPAHFIPRGVFSSKFRGNDLWLKILNWPVKPPKCWSVPFIDYPRRIVAQCWNLIHRIHTVNYSGFIVLRIVRKLLKALVKKHPNLLSENLIILPIPKNNLKLFNILPTLTSVCVECIRFATRGGVEKVEHKIIHTFIKARIYATHSGLHTFHTQHEDSGLPFGSPARGEPPELSCLLLRPQVKFR